MSTNLTVKELLNKKSAEIGKILPKHIELDRFIQLCNLAVLMNPKLAECDQKSLFSSFISCAKDGLVPDSREAFINTYKTKAKGANGRDEWIMKAQYQVMVDGLLKKIRQSGEVLSVVARAVFVNDEFDYYFDENGEYITYKPCLDGDNGGFRLVFAYAKMRSGELIVDVMTKAEVDRVRKASKAGDYGPWKDWYDRMAVKSVLHRLGRRLPNATEMLEMIEREIDIVKINDKAPPRALKQLELMPDDVFLEKSKQWAALINDGSMSPEDVIDTASNKNLLSDGQKQIIHELKKVA